jgi:predicted nucleic acid-binding protein
MNLVDSCGWIEYFADGKNADFYEKALKNTKKLIVPALCIFEVFKSLYRQKGEDVALQAAAVMEQGTVVGLDPSIAFCAAKISADRRLPMADSIILATAQEYKAVIWTQDTDFRDVEGVKYIPG